MDNSLTDGQFMILLLLGKYKGLTTSQIREFGPTYPHRQQINRELARLRDRDMIAGEPVNPLLGTRSEYYWWLLKAGADAVDVKHGNQYYRRPAGDLLEYRTHQIEIIRQIRQAGWHVIEPQSYNPQHPCPDDTRQAARLVQVAHAYNAELIQKMQAVLAANPNADWHARNEYERWIRERHEDRAWYVPRQMNDYVAYHPTRPRIAVVLILQPARAGAPFWLKLPPRNRTAKPGERVGRVKYYERLARQEFVQIVAVFTDEPTRQGYKVELEKAKFSVKLVNEIAAYLRALPDPDTTPPPLWSYRI